MASKTARKGVSWKHSPRVAWRKVADEAVILHVETAVYYSLGGPGLRMWELLGQGKTAAEVAAALGAEYEAPEELLRRDCEELAGKLRREGLIERA